MRRPLIALASLALLYTAPVQAAEERMVQAVLQEMQADPGFLALKAKADGGDPEAMVSLGDMVWGRLTGPSVFGGRDIAQRARLQMYDGAMRLGYVPAMKKLGLIALVGDGLPRDRRVALEFYRMAAEKGDLEAIMLAAELHLSDRDPVYKPVDVHKENQASLSIAELIEAWNAPPGPDQKLAFHGDEAVRLLSLPAARSDLKARRMLAAAYLDDKHFKEGARGKLALKAYDELTKLGYAEDYAAIGDLYTVGYPDLPADPAKAALYYGMAAGKGHGRAAWALGTMHVLGKGVDQSNALAFANFQKSAAAGYAKGMTSLGVCCLEGRGTAKSEAAAAGWFEKAADAGDGEGAFYLGELWKAGVDGTRNPMRAWLAYKRGAELGNEQAKAAFATFKPN